MGFNQKSYTIRGISYNVNSTFKCYSAQTGNANSEGTGGASIKLTQGATYTYLGYGTTSSGALGSYPYLVGDASGSGIGWFKETVFPYKTYTVTYNANGGTGAPAAGKKNHGVAYTLSTTKPTRTGYTFLGWNTSSTATTASHQPGGKTNANTNQNIIFYAVWKANTYTVKYNANGGKGSMANTTGTYGVSTNLRKNTFTKSGYSFSGWNAHRTGDNKWYYKGPESNGWYTEAEAKSLQGYTKYVYKDEQAFAKLTSAQGDTITMYAQWKLDCCVYIDNGTSFDKYLVYIDNGTSWDLYVPYTDNGSSWNSVVP
jgi:uncharacterized repeat protein (TIGR02543 family)